MNKIMIVIIAVFLFTLSSCNTEISEKNKTVETVNIENKTEESKDELIKIEEKRMKKETMKIEKIKEKVAEKIKEKVAEKVVEKEENKDIEEEKIKRFGTPAEFDSQLVVYDLKEKIFWETSTSKTAKKWSTSEKWAEPIFDTEGYVYSVDQDLLKSPAFSYCAEKGEGWRLPTQRELHNLIDVNEVNASGKKTELTYITKDLYWSSQQIKGTNSAWIADFSKGKIRNDIEGNGKNNIYIICVHNELDLNGGISDEEYWKDSEKSEDDEGTDYGLDGSKGNWNISDDGVAQ